jgi:small subunit ribosomal protein S19e
MARTIFVKDPASYIPALANELKKLPEFEVPEWVLYVKSGVSRERPPVSEDFWFLRAASILRQLYFNGVVGVGRLRVKYGSRKDRGGRPDKFKKAGGKIIRLILQQAEKAGLVEKVSKMQHGRRLTSKGKEFLDSIEVESSKGVDLSNVKVSSSLQEDETDKIEINESVDDEE